MSAVSVERGFEEGEQDFPIPERVDLGLPEKLTKEEVEKRVEELWKDRDKIMEEPLSERERELGITKLPDFINEHPEIPVFFNITAEQLDSHPDRLGEFNELWQKFILGDKMSKEERGLFETYYRNFMKFLKG